ncbi:MAG: ABC transporter ATP-binding protein/permease [Acetatifactor sp.]|nr:ABC transporter ATP-binding protein/permease [Acetatifactor sp.]
MKKQLLLRYLICCKREILCVLFFSLLSSVMTVACSKIMNNVIGETLNGNGNDLWIALVLLCCIAIVWVAFVYVQRFSSGKLGICLTQKLRQDVTEKLMAVWYDCFVEQESGTFLNRLNDDIRDTADYIDKLLSSILSNGIIIVVIAAYLITVDWKLLFASMLWIPIATLIFRFFLKKISSLTWEKKRRQDQLTNIIQESFASTETEKSFNLQERNLEIANNSIDRILAVDLKQQRQEAFITPFSFVIQSLPTLLCCIFAAYLSFHGSLAVEDFVSFIVLLGFISQPLTNFTSVLVDLRKAGVGVERLSILLNMPEETGGGESIPKRKAGTIISFQNVSFAYSGSENTIKKVSFDIKRGERVAFVGGSGSGKTTLINLILGLYPIENGSYYLYDIPFANIHLEEARKYFSIVSQETFLFPDTIEENLRYGNRNATQEDIDRAIRAVGLEEYILGLPDGYRTILEEGGSNLSGGQKQRIAIARALLRESDIVLMDEPTSSLDPKSESEIVKLVDNVLTDKTIITIAHKLNTVRDYDCIYVLDKGKIIEKGTHKALMEKGGVYYRLYTGMDHEGGNR